VPEVGVGAFYVNLVVGTADQSAVAAALAGRSALVTPAIGGFVIVADEAADTQDQDVIRSLARGLSSRLDCPVLAVMNHDDDILWYCLAGGAEIVDEYDSAPGYFDADADVDEDGHLPSPAGGDAKRLCAAFGSSAVERVQEVLRKPSFDDGGYVFAGERHSDLVTALGLPQFSVGFGFVYASAGSLPEGLSQDQLLRTN